MSELDLLARQVGTTSRTLRRALEQGALRGTRVSPRKLKLSATEKDYVLRRWKLLARLRSALRTEPNVRFALLFGSAARGEETEASDLDLLVELHDDSWARQVDLELRLEEQLGRSVDTVSLAEAGSNPLLLGDALREGRVLVDRAGRWADLKPQVARLERQARLRARRDKREALAGIEALLAR